MKHAHVWKEIIVAQVAWGATEAHAVGRSMYRFTIRDVLWLVLVSGLALGWWRASYRGTEDLHWRAKAQLLGQELGKHGYTVEIGNDSLDVRDQTGKSILQLD